MTPWIDRLLNRLDRLRNTDPQFQVFGSYVHRYRFGPLIPPKWLSWVEAKYEITLPEQYRQFLLEAGNGGVGPHYGLQRFGFLESPDQSPAAIWTVTSHAAGSLDLYLPDGTPTDGFETKYFESIRSLAGGNSLLTRPFPFTDAKYSCQEVVEILKDYSWGTPEAPRWYVPGAIYLADYGCGITQMLVLNGRWAGSIWEQNTANDEGYRLEAESFEKWYEAWIEKSLQHCARCLTYRGLMSRFATNDPAEGRELEALLQSYGIGCELEELHGTTIVLVKSKQREEADALISKFMSRKK